MLTSKEIFKQLHIAPHEALAQAQQEDETGTWLYSCESGEYWCSNELYRIYRLDKKVHLTREMFLRFLHDDDRERVGAAFAEALAGGKAYYVMHRIWVNGKVKWLEQRGRYHRGKKGAGDYMLGIVRDMTSRKQKEVQLEAQRADFAAITQYLAETTDTTKIEAIVASVKRTIRRRMDAALIGVFVRQDKTVKRVMPKSMESQKAFLFQEMEEFVGYRAIMMGKRQVMPVDDYANELGRKALLDLGGRQVVSLPIKHGGKAIGALSVVSCRDAGLTAQEDEFCRTLCGYLSSQLNNALLYDRLKQELALRVNLESDRDAIFNEGVDCIAIIGADGRFAQINPAFAQRLGAPPEVLAGKLVFDYIHPEDKEYAHQVFHELPRLGVVRGLCNRFVGKNGEVSYLENNLKYIESNRSVIAMARDNTSQRAIEERNSLLEETVSFERTKSEFFAGLSHEFKTPLNIILSSLDLMRLKSKKENEAHFEKEYAKFFDYATQNCYRLLRLSTNLLDASQLEDGRYRLHVTRVRLDTLLSRVVESAAVYAGARGVQLDFQSVSGGDLWLACDEDGVERIVLNLLSNAIKNSRQGGMVRVALYAERKTCRVTVDDNGCGIPAEILPHIFDKFITTRNPITGQREGSGVGLSLVKSLTELHGGTVSAQSEMGVGSCFTFTLARGLPISEETERPIGSAAAVHTRLELSDVK